MPVASETEDQLARLCGRQELEMNRLRSQRDRLYDRLNTMSLAFHENYHHGGLFSECDSDVCMDNREALAFVQRRQG